MFTAELLETYFTERCDIDGHVHLRSASAPSNTITDRQCFSGSKTDVSLSCTGA